MNTFTRLPRFAFLLSAAVPAMLSAQGTTTTTTTTTVVARDTTLTYVIKDKEGVQIMLRTGVTYGAVIDGREIKLEVKPAGGSLREAIVDDVSLPGSMEATMRYNIRVDDTGLYEFRVTGLLTGRDVVLRLTGPTPIKKQK